MPQIKLEMPKACIASSVGRTQSLRRARAEVDLTLCELHCLEILPQLISTLFVVLDPLEVLTVSLVILVVQLLLHLSYLCLQSFHADWRTATQRATVSTRLVVESSAGAITRF